MGDEERTQPEGPKRPSLAPRVIARLSNPAPMSISASASTPPKRTGLWALLAVAIVALVALAAVVSSNREPTEAEVQAAAPSPVADPEPEPAPETAPQPKPEKAPEPAEDPAIAAQPQPVPDPEPEPFEPPSPPPERVAPAGALESLAVVVHPSNPIASLDVSGVRRIFLEERTWPDGAEADPVGRYASGALRRLFLRRILQMSHAEVQAYFGEGESPGSELGMFRRFPTDEAVVRYVAGRPEAMGYIDWTRTPQELRGQVKAILVVDVKGGQSN